MITEEDMSYEDMIKTASTHKCYCGSRLNVAWGGYYGIEGYILKCSKDIEHDKLTRYNKKQEEIYQMAKDDSSISSTSLMAMDEAHMLARIEKAKFPQELKSDEKKLLAIACITYGFDPIMHELTIYQGNPYVSIDGRYRKAQETGKLDGVETRPASKQERSDWDIPDGDYFFRAEVRVKGSKFPFVGWGRVRQSETKPGSSRSGDTTSIFKPIQSNPQRMAEKRAEAMALRKAFHIPLPSAEYIGTYEEEPVVDVETGEIIDAEVVEEKDVKLVTRPQIDELNEALKTAGMDNNALSDYFKSKGWEIHSKTEITVDQFKDIMDWIKEVL